uniref:Uncharacterized protein n=1 Tax=Timema tahoe TaxID=61484 RepID=A0A7R9NXP7_9NEOP|nr:unnamed protein product [Timema tahoe]
MGRIMSLSKPRKTPMEEGPSCSRKKRETCTHQRQEDIINVAAVIRQEMMDDFDSINLAEKTARYLKLSVNTVRRYYNQRIGQVETLDDFTRDSVRHVIYRMYHEGKYLSMDTILLAIRAAEINFHGGKSALTKLLKIMGFKWQKDCGRKALMEETNICAKRICFLREYLQHMSDSIYVEKLPTKSWKKEEYAAWLQKNAMKILSQFYDIENLEAEAKTGCRYLPPTQKNQNDIDSEEKDDFKMLLEA